MVKLKVGDLVRLKDRFSQHPDYQNAANRTLRIYRIEEKWDIENMKYRPDGLAVVEVGNNENTSYLYVNEVEIVDKGE